MGAISGVDLRLVGSHAGVEIGADGPSQMGLEDLAMLRAIHGSTVLYPGDATSTAAERIAAAVNKINQVVREIADRSAEE
jgi:transketolase